MRALPVSCCSNSGGAGCGNGRHPAKSRHERDRRGEAGRGSIVEAVYGLGTVTAERRFQLRLGETVFPGVPTVTLVDPALRYLTVSLELQGAHRNHPPVPVLREILLEIRRGEFVSLVGRSGSGKSTLLYVASAIDPPTSGRVLYDGVDVTRLSSTDLHALRNRRLRFVFRFHYLLPELSAVENVLMPAMKAGRHRELRPRAEALLREVGLEGEFDRLPRQLSGGGSSARRSRGPNALLG